MTLDEALEGLEESLSILEGPDPDELWSDWRDRSIEFRRTWLRKIAKSSMPVTGGSAPGTAPQRGTGATFKHWRDATGKWWHEFYQGGKGHPADPAHAFQEVDMPCDCDPPPTKDETGPVTDAR